MSRRCQITGRGPQVGHKVSHAHNIALRRWNINLQKVRVLINGRVKKMRVSTQAIKSGLIVKPPVKIRTPKPRIQRIAAPTQAASVISDDQPMQFFSDSSVVSRLFKPKPKPGEAPPEESDLSTEMKIEPTDEPRPSGANVLSD